MALDKTKPTQKDIYFNKLAEWICSRQDTVFLRKIM